MAAKYRKIDPRIWDDEGFQQLDSRGKLVAIELITGQSNRLGIFRVNYGTGAERCAMTIATYRSRIGHVLKAFGWKFDTQTRVLWLDSWWKYNPPESPAALYGRLKDLHDVPECSLKKEFKESLSTALGESAKWLSRASRDQEQEQEEEPLTPPASGGESVPLRPGKRNPRALGTNPRATAAKAKADEIKRRTRLLATIRKHGEKTLANGSELQGIGIYRKKHGLLTWDRVTTELLASVAQELES